jgi:small-conductance mechanosensitive channel
VRRFSLVGLYGYFGIQAGGFLGLPAVGFDALIRLLGLVLTFMLAALILRLRKPVARWIRGIEGKTMWRLRGRLAAVWHILALLYVALLYGIWALQVDDGATTMLRGTALSVVTLILAAWAVSLVGDSARPCVSPEPVPQTIPQQLRRRLIRYVPALRAAARWLIRITAVLAFLQAWGVPSFAWFAQDPGRILALTAASSVVTILVALIVWEGSSLAISAYLAEHDDRAGLPPLRSARTRTLLSVARTALTVVLSAVTILIVLSEVGVNIAPLLAAAGVLGLAVGFGSQQLLKDLITGFFILLEDVFSVGDVIKVGERAGVVEEVSIRTVRLRDLAGTVHTIPFSTIDSVSNLTKEFAFHVFDLGVAYREDVDQVMDTLREIGAETWRSSGWTPSPIRRW